MNSVTQISKLETINNQIASQEIEAGRKKGSVNLIAVSKTKSMDQIKPVIDEGHSHFGENKVQEAVMKWQELKKENKVINLHLLGPLQSNKVKIALEIFDVIQTIDREKIVLKIKDLLNSEYHARTYKFFIQVNIGNEEQKSGVKISDLSDFIEWTVKDQKLKVDGLMCIPPYDEDPSLYFNLLRQLCDNHNLQHASMGMTNDFEKAVKFGATYLRVGSGIFGKRS